MACGKRFAGIQTVCGGILIHLSLGTLYTFGNLSPYLTSYLRFRTSDKSLVYSDTMWIFAVAVMGHACTMILGGLSDKRLGSRLTAFLGSCTMSLGVFMTHFSVQKSFGATVFTYGFVFGFGTGIAYAVPMGCAMKWFPNRRGLINGLIVSGFGAGAFIFDQVQTAYVNPDNVKANVTVGPNNEKYFNQHSLLDRVPKVFLILGSVYLTMQIIGCLLLTQPDYQVNEVVTSSSSLIPEHNRHVSRNNETTDLEYSINSFQFEEMDPLKVIKTREFWTLWVMFLFNSQSVMFIATLYKAYGETFIQNDRLLAIVGSFAAVCNGGGRILWGYLADRFTFKKTMIVQCCSLIFLFFTFTLTEKVGPWMYFIWVCLIFGSFSGNFALFPTATAKSFGQKYFTINFGMVFTSLFISGPVGTILAENLSDTLGWFGLFALVGGFSFVSLCLAFTFNVKYPNGEDI